MKSFWTRPEWRLALGAVMMLRVGVGAVMALTWSVTIKANVDESFLASSHPYDGLPVYTTFPLDVLLGVWQRWDAIHFLDLAAHGYLGVPEPITTYFFLYPMLTRVVSWILGENVLVSGLLVSTISLCAALVGLYRLTEERYGSVSARWAVIALTIYPVAVFLIAPFSESLFLALTVWTFLAAYRRHWWWAGAYGALASLTRSQGILTPLALAWIALDQWRIPNQPLWKIKWQGWRGSLAVGAGLILPILGGASFFLWRQAMGFAPYEEIWRIYGGSYWVNPIWNLITAVQQFVVVHDVPTTLDIGSLFLFTALIIALVLQRRWRRVEWIVYMSANLLLFLSKHNEFSAALQSLSRYVLALFPGFIVLGDWLAERSRWRLPYVVLSGTLLILSSALYAMWFFIG